MTRRDLLLGGGALAGALLAAVTMTFPATPGGALDADVVATVDGRPILREHYERALAAVAADRREPLDGDDRRRVLERLIEEELLIGRALELSLASRDRRVRADLAAAMLDLVRTQGEPATLDALRAFYTTEAGRFRRPPRFQIEHAFFASRGTAVDADGTDGSRTTRDEDARRRAERAIAAGELSASGDPFGLPVPTEPVPLSALGRLLGPTAARGIAQLAEGRIGGPWRGTGGYHVARVVTRFDGEVPPFDAIVDVVREEHARVAAEERLRDLLAEERAHARIQVAE